MERNLIIVVNPQVNSPWFEGSSYIEISKFEDLLSEKNTLISNGVSKANYISKSSYSTPEAYIETEDRDLIPKNWEKTGDYTGIFGQRHSEPNQIFLINVMNGDMYDKAYEALSRGDRVLLGMENLCEFYSIVGDIFITLSEEKKDFFVENLFSAVIDIKYHNPIVYQFSEIDRINIAKGDAYIVLDRIKYNIENSISSF